MPMKEMLRPQPHPMLFISFHYMSDMTRSELISYISSMMSQASQVQSSGSIWLGDDRSETVNQNKCFFSCLFL